MNKNTILEIIHDFDTHIMPTFFDLEKYETDFEVSRHMFKSLRIGYIEKAEISHPEKAIYINFHKKFFSISIFNKTITVEKEIFRDDYQNFDTVEDIYKRIKLICQNKDNYLYDELIFNELDNQIVKFANLNEYNEKTKLFCEMYAQLVDMEKTGKIVREKGKKPISYLRQIIDNDGSEFCYTIKFKPIWNDKREYQVGVCVRGDPLLRKIK